VKENYILKITEDQIKISSNSKTGMSCFNEAPESVMAFSSNLF
jgi:hypothetical protein